MHPTSCLSLERVQTLFGLSASTSGSLLTNLSHGLSQAQPLGGLRPRGEGDGGGDRGLGWGQGAGGARLQSLGDLDTVAGGAVAGFEAAAGGLQAQAHLADGGLEAHAGGLARGGHGVADLADPADLLAGRLGDLAFGQLLRGAGVGPHASGLAEAGFCRRQEGSGGRAAGEGQGPRRCRWRKGGRRPPGDVSH